MLFSFQRPSTSPRHGIPSPLPSPDRRGVPKTTVAASRRAASTTRHPFSSRRSFRESVSKPSLDATLVIFTSTNLAPSTVPTSVILGSAAARALYLAPRRIAVKPARNNDSRPAWRRRSPPVSRRVLLRRVQPALSRLTAPSVSGRALYEPRAQGVKRRTPRTTAAYRRTMNVARWSGVSMIPAGDGHSSGAPRATTPSRQA